MKQDAVHLDGPPALIHQRWIHPVFQSGRRRNHFENRTHAIGGNGFIEIRSLLFRTGPHPRAAAQRQNLTGLHIQQDNGPAFQGGGRFFAQSLQIRIQRKPYAGPGLLPCIGNLRRNPLQYPARGPHGVMDLPLSRIFAQPIVARLLDAGNSMPRIIHQSQRVRGQGIGPGAPGSLYVEYSLVFLGQRTGKRIEKRLSPGKQAHHRLFFPAVRQGGQ